MWKALTAHPEVTHGIYQGLMAAYAASDKQEGTIAMYTLLKSIWTGVPEELPEPAQLGRSLWKQHREILAVLLRTG